MAKPDPTAAPIVDAVPADKAGNKAGAAIAAAAVTAILPIGLFTIFLNAGTRHARALIAAVGPLHALVPLLRLNAEGGDGPRLKTLE